jgi:hypothetical protein
VERKEFPISEVSLSDIELANRLAAEVLGRTLDELPPQTRRCLELAHSWVSEQCKMRGIEQSSLRFGRRDLAEALGWSYPAVRKHLDRLVELEHVLVHRGGRGQSFVYELLWDGKGSGGEAFLAGLIDVDALRHQPPTTLTPSEQRLTSPNDDLDPPLHPHSPPSDPRLSLGKSADKTSDRSTYETKPGELPANARRVSSDEDGRYVRRGGEMKQRAGAA